MTVRLLTEEQAAQLQGVEVIPDNLFNPIQDGDGKWIISNEEADQCSIDWVKSLTQIEYNYGQQSEFSD